MRTIRSYGSRVRGRLKEISEKFRRGGHHRAIYEVHVEEEWQRKRGGWLCSAEMRGLVVLYELSIRMSWRYYDLVCPLVGWLTDCAGLFMTVRRQNVSFCGLHQRGGERGDAGRVGGGGDSGETISAFKNQLMAVDGKMTTAVENNHIRL